MHTTKKPAMKNLLFFIVILFLSFDNLHSQEKIFQERVLIMKIKPEAGIVLPDYDIDNHFENRNNDYQFMTEFVESHDIVKLERPYKTLNTSNLNNIYKISLEKDVHIFNLMKDIEGKSNVEYVERMPIYKTFEIPNDPNLENLWFLQTIDAFNGWGVG